VIARGADRTARAAAASQLRVRLDRRIAEGAKKTTG